MDDTIEKIEKKVAEKKKVTYSKKSLLSFKRFSNRVDLLGALLSDNGEYTLEEVDSMIKNFMKG